MEEALAEALGEEALQRKCVEDTGEDMIETRVARQGTARVEKRLPTRCGEGVVNIIPRRGVLVS